VNQFPEFMRRPANAVKQTSQAGGLEGYVFDGADGSQVVIWQCAQGGRSEMDTHDFDEYAIVAQGTFAGTIGGRAITLGPGDEYFIPAGVPHDGEYSAGYRAIDAFGGKRVERA